MDLISASWDYLVLTAGSETQALGYQRELELRRELGLFRGVRDSFALSDPSGYRMGSGGSTLYCLITIVNREISRRGLAPGPDSVRQVLESLRVFVIHAGGDSQQLPGCGRGGKIFTPLPMPGDACPETTLFDIQWPVYRRIPPPLNGQGQFVVSSGDVLLDFDPGQIELASPGVTGLGCRAAPEQASRHGVFCLAAGGQVRRYLQKPAIDRQRDERALDGFGRSLLDIGVVHFDATVAAALLDLCRAQPGGDGQLAWSGPIAEALAIQGLDFYREILCALGSESSLESYRESIRGSGSTWSDCLAEKIFTALSGIPFQAQIIKECSFLHFGTTREIIHSGQALLHRDGPPALGCGCLTINSVVEDTVRLPAVNAWLESCTLRSPLELEGENVLTGVDVCDPLKLGRGACLDIVPGASRQGDAVHFICCYHESDVFSGNSARGATLCGYPIDSWVADSGARVDDLWDAQIPVERRVPGNARLFPAETAADAYRRWLWMHAPAEAKARDFVAWREADRYSLEEIALRADRRRWDQRRRQIRETILLGSLRQRFTGDSGFSAADLCQVLCETDQPLKWLAAMFAEARWHLARQGAADAEETFAFARVAHSLGTALERWADKAPGAADAIRRQIDEIFVSPGIPKLAGVAIESSATPVTAATVATVAWGGQLKRAAFDDLRARIMASGANASPPSDPAPLPRSGLRSDEIVWGRAPARLDLAGGWTDTPPFALEHGGQVLNAAVELNDQPPIHVYARVVPELVIRCRSIDRGTQEEIRSWDELCGYLDTPSEFSLPKAALVLCGFKPQGQASGPGWELAETLRHFGGGLELTTLAAIPKGSGLGTSSIMGAVLVATIQRVCGARLAPRELFHAVLQLEQLMTTGGGWQDQVGGVCGGLKLITTRPGIVPDPTLRYVPAEALDPKPNGGQTLLYYTGVTRLAKNILQEVVGRWLDRDREAVETLQQIRGLAGEMTEAVARKDLAEFGRMIDVAWQLNKRLDPNSTTAEIESLLEKVRPHLYGAKLLGAGGGGFLLMVCRSPGDAQSVKARLETDPPNPRARFFDFSLSQGGLAVSVC